MNILYKNIFWLLTVQMANFLLPLITLPYLGRAIGVNQFGVAMTALSLMQMLILISDYGFNLSATKKISINRDNKALVNETFSAVIIIKFILMLVCFFILIILMNFIPVIHENEIFFLLFFGMVFGNLFFPLWFFQGIEKMKVSSILNVVTKFIFCLLIIVLVRGKEDFLLIPVCYSVGYIVSGFIGLGVACIKFKVKFYIPNIRVLRANLMESNTYFFSRVSVSMYSLANTFIIGACLGSITAGYFSAAEKLYNVILTVISVISDALFPYMAKNKNLKLYKLIFSVTMACAFIGIWFLYNFASPLLNLVYGHAFSESIIVFKVLIISTLFAVPSILIGYPLLAAFELERYTNYSVVVASIIHILLLVVLIPTKSLIIFSSILILTQLIVLVIRLIGVKKFINMDRSRRNNVIDKAI
ncbi:oligosaccharide flippase family protein [Priestia megaterium]|uniref:oligosaccharide flippase family protein n=1 Tax=Priestia megaterium TaxID=1404 RepID=UPI002FFE7845